MKKIVSVLAVFSLIACFFAGCSGSGTSKKFSVVTTIFPVYDWVKQIAGDAMDDIELTMLLDNGVDLHNYTPTAADIITISSCDLFIYVGGESDKWVDDVLANATNKDMVVINLLEVLGDKALCAEDLEGMEHTHDHGEEGHEEHDDHDHHDHAKDEHVWLSLKNAAFFCNYIADKLQSIDAGNKDIYAANTASYVEALTALDEEYQAAVTEASRNTLLFGDRFPFRYLASDYSLHCYAAFSGCSAESEASFETIAFLAKKVDELNLTTVLTIDNADKKVAETIIASTQAKNAAILSLNSLQATTLADAKNGVTYLNIMKENLETLTKALN